MTIRWWKRGLFISAMLGLVSLGVLAQRDGYFRLTDVSVILDPSAPKAYSLYASDLENELSKLKGQDLWRLDLEDLNRHLSSLSWVSEHQSKRRFPNQLEVHIVGRKALAMILDRKGQLRPLSDSGMVLPPIRANQALELPVVQDPRLERDQDLRLRLVQLLVQLPQEGRLSLREIDAIQFSRKGQFLFLPKGLKKPVHIGEAEVGLRAARVARVLDYLDHNRVEWREINADFTKKVVVKKETDQSPN